MYYFLLMAFLSLSKAHDCKEIKSYKDFYFCTLEKHPKYEISKLRAVEAAASIEKANQWQNPELSLKTISGDKAGERVGSTEIEATISVSQFWIRSSKVKIADVDNRIADIDSRLTVLKIQVEILKDLYRLRQLISEIELVNETLVTYEKIKEQLKSRIVRGPEQEITLNLVELAVSDYMLKRNHLSIEKSEILSKLKAIWGDGFVIKNSYLPPVKRKWPLEFNLAKMSNNFDVQRAVLENERATVDKELVMKETWPDLDLGGIVNRTTEGPSQFMNYGVSLKMSLPLVSFNSGSRRLAQSKIIQSQLLADLSLKKADNDKEILLQRYKSAVSSLSKSISQDDVVKKHNKVDNLFKNGLASGSLIIEAHRQISEYTESQHEHENIAIAALLELKTLNNESLDEVFND